VCVCVRVCLTVGSLSAAVKSRPASASGSHTYTHTHTHTSALKGFNYRAVSVNALIDAINLAAINATLFTSGVR